MAKFGKKREKRAGAGERVKSPALEFPLIDSNGLHPFAPKRRNTFACFAHRNDAAA
jgi:hypothetical protein